MIHLYNFQTGQIGHNTFLNACIGEEDGFFDYGEINEDDNMYFTDL